jgi:hypothetical protein
MPSLSFLSATVMLAPRHWRKQLGKSLVVMMKSSAYRGFSGN